MSEKCSPSIRPLFAWEIQESKKVFGRHLHYEKVRIHECTTWPDRINQIGLRLKRMPVVKTHNAITLGNHLYFPIRMLRTPVAADHPEFYKMGWFIHELTHAWQYQQMGWIYLYKALSAQMRLGAKAYDFGGEKGLLEGLQKNWNLDHYNLEQQGDILRSYYERISSGKTTHAWDPLIREIQQSIYI